MIRVLFVCLGNICHSPSAEGVFRHLVDQEGLSDQIQIDSCGTLDHHEGEEADPRMRKHAKGRGYDLKSIARGIRPEDFKNFDHIITMDDSNFDDVIAMAKGDEQNKVQRMTDFCSHHKMGHVPDPYFGGPEGFELVLDLLEDACKGLLQQLKVELKK